MTKYNVLLLVGSPKARSTSEVLGTFVTSKLSASGMDSSLVNVTAEMKSSDKFEHLLSRIGAADIIILASPLYVDSLPSPVIRMMENIVQRKGGIAEKQRRFLAILNCGFPEARHNDTALRQCRLFCSKAGFEWVGGLGLGAGGSLDGLPLEKRGGMVKNVIQALSEAAECLAAGVPLPESAEKLMARPIMPTWLYLLFGGLGWRRQAKKFGALGRINDRPFTV